MMLYIVVTCLSCTGRIAYDRKVDGAYLCLLIKKGEEIQASLPWIDGSSIF